MAFWHEFTEQCSTCSAPLSPEFARCGECASVAPNLAKFAMPPATAGRCVLTSSWTDVKLPSGDYLAAAAVLRLLRFGWLLDSGEWARVAGPLVAALNELRRAPHPRDPHRTLRATMTILGFDGLVRGNIDLSNREALERMVAKNQLPIPEEVYEGDGRSTDLRLTAMAEAFNRVSKMNYINNMNSR